MGRAIRQIQDRRVYDAAMQAVNRLFSDTTVERSQTREDLKSLRDEIDVMLDDLQSARSEEPDSNE